MSQNWYHLLNDVLFNDYFHALIHLKRRHELTLDDVDGVKCPNVLLLVLVCNILFGNEIMDAFG